jgi:hypothetical protein
VQRCLTILIGAQTGYDKTQCMHGGWENNH